MGTRLIQRKIFLLSIKLKNLIIKKKNFMKNLFSENKYFHIETVCIMKLNQNKFHNDLEKNSKFIEKDSSRVKKVQMKLTKIYEKSEKKNYIKEFFKLRNKTRFNKLKILYMKIILNFLKRFYTLLDTYSHQLNKLMKSKLKKNKKMNKKKIIFIWQSLNSIVDSLLKEKINFHKLIENKKIIKNKK